jgi:mono/diheme cytochrome c family protein
MGRSAGISGRQSGRQSGHLSAAAYFGCVALLTLAGVGVAMLAQPAFGHGMLQWIGLEAVPQAEAMSFYSTRVASLFETHCVSCHGDRRQKAGLRLDSYAALLRGGKDGAVIRPGDPKNSELFHRISLPVSDERAMPPSGKTVLTPDDVTVIRLWIAQGASGTQRTIPGAPRLVPEVKIPRDDPEITKKERAPLLEQLHKLQAEFPGVIAYQSRSSAGMEVNASLRGPAFGDAQLQALMPLQARIVRMDLSGTAVSDASAALLATMPALQVLRLGDSKITGTTIAALAHSKSLKSLTIGDIKVDDGTLAPLLQKHVTVYGGAGAP